MTDRHPQQASHDPVAHERSVPDLVLERSRLGELPPPEQDGLARRIEAEPELRHRLAALERSDADLRRRLEATHLPAGVRARLAARREGTGARAGDGSRDWRPAGLAVAATVALVLTLRTIGPTPRLAGPVGPATPSPPPPAPSATPALSAPSTAPARAPASPTGEPGVRTKGLRASLSLFRRTADGSETLADGDVARQGDLIRVGYRSYGRRYGVIVSLDGRGGVTRHLPERGAMAALLEASEVVLLAHAYQLDDAPAWERFFFVTADAPFEVATVEEALRQVAGGRRRTAAGQAPARLRLPNELEQSTFLLMKDSRP